MGNELERWLARVGPSDVLGAMAGLLPDVAWVVTDRERRIILWSPEAERLLGWPRERVLGAPCPVGVCEADPGAVFGAVVRMPREDGALTVLRRYARSFADRDGQPLGVVNALVRAELPADGATVPADAVVFHRLISRDPAMIRVFETIRNVAETEATVLVRGESGTGKELVARAVHDESHRRDGPFVAVNCASLAPTLLESELFGHKKGAFTGAVSDRTGIFAQADGGTLFLDEVAEIPLELQAKLLRVLQERSFTPVGSDRLVKVDVRVVAATHRALREEVRAGRFREDLMFRLRVVPIFLPPLRDRRLDVELLLRRFLELHNQRGPRRIDRIAPEAMRALLDHPWPGNVRELENVLEYAFAVGRGHELQLEDLPPEFRERRAAPAVPAPEGAPTDEAGAIREALARNDGDFARAAESLGMSRTTFWRKRKKYDV